MDADDDVRKMAPSALHAHIQRCERLLSHPTLLGRLPDGGAAIRGRHALYVAERSRREAVGDASSGTTEQDAAEEAVRQVEQQICQITISPEAASKQTADKWAECHASPNTGEWGVEEGERAVESYGDAARAIGEKHRHSPVPVETIVRQTFGGSLCEAEIQRMLHDVPPNFFLTYEETTSMQRRLLAEERQEALKRLQQQMHAEQ
ncbi:putative protein kinase [Trypanosoma rangeli]|uniref:Uncharacterized protein n=1 Tax=Trypanosoma rangeli TaxID=5698 RepID=A0A422N1X3_TRYRA|nr:putative protein kinase [Trypanosoma rangeli]RNE99461.1 putative protein kinase [Trypanosoma rangeli]|eukprot:RNE99461.1 putative protein kinase [Trypanosoma rangeli]